MIEKIKGVSNFGIFKNIESNPTYSNFNKLNLFYGLNGSGKSTISHLFSLIESNESISRFPDSKWSFEKGGKIYSESDKFENDFNIKVFNADFVERNINWNDTIKGILVVSNDKNEEILKLKDKKKEKLKISSSIAQNELILNGEKKRNKGLIRNNSNFLSESAKNIKQKFQLIEVEDKHLSNYNKTKIESSLNKNKDNIRKASLTIQEIEKLAQTIKPQDKDRIETPDFSVLSQITSGFEKIISLLNSKITSEVIDGLKNDFKKSDWVKLGLELHKAEDNCAFCGNNISKQRISTLNNHFSDSFKNLQEQLSKAITWIEELKTTELPSYKALYKEYQAEYEKIKKDIDFENEKLIKALDKWKAILKTKASNPFEIPKTSVLNFDETNLIKLYKKATEIIKSHNRKYLSASTIIQEAKNNLELEYIKDEIKRYDFYKQKNLEITTNQKNKELQLELEKIKMDIKQLNSLISTEALGATKFNNDLWKFLGRKDIALDPQEKGGYKLQRNGNPNTNGNQLSEGEKTAIAFVYFINKILEQDNKINDTTIIVDDPISSFDSNNLFSSYSYLKLNCNEAKQLFILTHNFNYYRLVRDWFETKNKKQNQKHRKDPSKPETICNIYSIESNFDTTQIRFSYIKDADPTLLEYTSEYHYLFKKLITYSNDTHLDLDKAYLSANASRKILETFLKFKHPKRLGDFRQLLQKGIQNTSFKDKEEYIYRFINKYSHAQDFDNDSSDNKLDEGSNVVKDILNLIKEIDEIHYKEMIEVCEK
ncbi:AAA family ATPase [Polaribacter sp. Z014]|uniref:AAA family ATPase n=1 Tax=Polaribacter sp. Z014 TaxID=2927126 RepID=UPI0020202786|nr:AAA family ATPase [Polaribacter sp. Z014]MCL7765467.1 AAA family ATPase [Polaribacter sp. Z014]